MHAFMHASQHSNSHYLGRRYQEALQREFMQMKNGDLLLDGLTVHCCDPSVGCNCLSKQDTIDRMVRLDRHTVYRRRLPKPSLSEWSNVRTTSAFSLIE